ncbi:MAG: hypothetical protein H7177_05905 [Rhizobacter sp.]|nr:hypothetical protein [Bacteriovorax sp.]
MKKRLLLIIIFLTSYDFVSANEYWKKDYSKIDSFALTIKETSNIDTLSNELTQNYLTDLEKYRAIFAWITHNISYDCIALKNPRLRETDANKVIKNRKAVCAGYSNLFQKLCESANLECNTISGWSYHKENIGEPLGNNSNHSWNAIKIQNDWYLCDVTWGAGSTSENNRVFTFDFKDYYFCTPSLLFSYNHLPEDKKWLLGVKLAPKKFTNNPHYYPQAINLNVRDLKPSTGIIKYKKNQTIEFEFTVDDEIKRITIMPSNAKKSTIIDFALEDNRIKFDYVLDSYSPYIYIYIDSKPLVVYKIKK